METKETLTDGVLVVELLGRRLDASTAPAFKSKMVDLINQGNLFFALDFSGLEFMDSTGLGSLISCVKSLGGAGEIVLFGLNEGVRKVFTITRLDRGVFKLFAGKAEALQALSGKPA